MAIIIPVYSIYNIINTYKLDKLDREYEIALIIYISHGIRNNSTSFVYNFKISYDEKVYRKNYFGSPKTEKYQDNEFIFVKFNENKTYFIIKDHVFREYIGDTILFLIAFLFIYLSIVLFRVLLNKKY